ncbi:hypothetical protein CSOJ01_13329 [Colletotrichum sojae]|uniref:Uncharacterized protein n=1 Tax=Colletotrichum sojae TaxID=2175907 RepID=A0A8H6ISK8_9PEZI|nr:hypothetical protein CSOJ01_13329 [Colletotrichum sojae]
MHLITQTRLTALPLGPSGPTLTSRRATAAAAAQGLSVVTRSQDPDTGTERAALRSRQGDIGRHAGEPNSRGATVWQSCGNIHLRAAFGDRYQHHDTGPRPGEEQASSPSRRDSEAPSHGARRRKGVNTDPAGTCTIADDKPQPAALRAIPIHACIKFRARQQVKFQKTIDRCAAQNGRTAHSSAIGGQTVRSSALIDGILARDGRVARRRSREPGASTAIHITQPTDRKHDSWDPAVWGTSIGTEHRAQGTRQKAQMASRGLAVAVHGGERGVRRRQRRQGLLMLWFGGALSVPTTKRNISAYSGRFMVLLQCLSLASRQYGTCPAAGSKQQGKGEGKATKSVSFSPGDAASTMATERKADRV